MSGNIRSALNVLAELRGGQVVTEASAALHDALASVKEHNKAATVTITLKIAPLSEARTVERPIEITAEISSKLPKAEPPATMFFIDEDGNPTRNPQPREPELGFSVAGERTAS